MVPNQQMAGICLAVLALAPATAAAQQPAVRQACGADFQQYCAEVQPGDSRLGTCVEQHFSEFSEGCKQALVSNVDLVRICKPEVQRTCSGAEPGGGHLQLCMKDHFSEYSHRCRRAIIIAKFGNQ
jgi:hypothetical protein